jgi:uncharacterized cupredoxin-like copper-binding protein
MRNAKNVRRAVALGLVLGAALVAVGVACGGGGDSGETVDVSIKDAPWTLTPSPATAPAGKVTFSATNDGTMQHELVIIKTDTPVDQLPTANDAVDTAAAGEEIGEIERFDAGTTEEATFDLTAGKYALICNIPAHYAQGLHASFTVE